MAEEFLYNCDPIQQVTSRSSKMES